MFSRMKPALAIASLCLFPSFAHAQSSAQVTGNLDGEVLDFSMTNAVGGMPALYLETYTDGDTPEVEVIAGAIEETQEGLDGVMLFLGLAAGPDSVANLPSSDMAYFAEAMVVDEWTPGAPFPETVWLAELDGFEIFEIDTLSFADEAGALSGRITSDRFCLHSFTGDEPIAVRRDGEMICKPGAVTFAMSTDGAATPPPPPPMEVEVLGRATGMVGRDSYDWITFLAPGAEPTATIDQDGAIDLLRLQAHDPASDNFLRDNLLSVTIMGDLETGKIPDGGTVPVELSFFTDEPGVFYSSEDGDGGVTANVLSFHVDGDLGEVDMVLEGQICKIDGFELVSDDCTSIEAQIATEIIRITGD